MPVQRDVFFVASGGAIYLPQAGVSKGQVRGDLVLRRSGGRSFSFGIRTLRSSTAVTFGGVF